MSNEELIAFLKKNIVAVICVVLCIGAGAAIYLRSDMLPEAEKTFQERSDKAALLAANIENMEQLKDQMASMNASNQAIADRMIKVGQLAENLQYFYRIENDTGVKLTDLRQNPYQPPAGRGAGPKPSYIMIQFQVSALGTYAQLMDLLRHIEGGEHYCRILNCSLKPSNSESRGNVLAMSLSLEMLGTQ